MVIFATTQIRAIFLPIRCFLNQLFSPELIEGNGYEGRQTSKGELFVKVFGMSRDFEGAHRFQDSG